MSAGFQFKPRIIGFSCNWCCYAGADLAGVSRYQYPPYVRLVRLMCSGRVDISFVLKAFKGGADGVFIGGCWPGECHYITEGNYDALGMVHVAKAILEHVGLNPDRLRLEWVSASEGIRFAEVMNDFARKLTKLGPAGKVEGTEANRLQIGLDAATRLIPYIRLVLAQRLKLRRSEEEYLRFFGSEEGKRLVRQTIVDELARTEISLLLERGPLSTGEIGKSLGLSASEVSSHLIGLSRHGLVRYDEGAKRFAVA
jgi:F420-non-reducing hydrogenase iron-sulfur subunit